MADRFYHRTYRLKKLGLTAEAVTEAGRLQRDADAFREKYKVRLPIRTKGRNIMADEMGYLLDHEKRLTTQEKDHADHVTSDMHASKGLLDSLDTRVATVEGKVLSIPDDIITFLSGLTTEGVDALLDFIDEEVLNPIEGDENDDQSKGNSTPTKAPKGKGANFIAADVDESPAPPERVRGGKRARRQARRAAKA